MSLDSPEARAQSRAIWDEMSAGWKKHNDYLWDTARPVGEWMVERLQLQPGQTVLDIASGPGDQGFVTAKIVGHSGKLISTDFSEDMVAVARERAATYGVTNAEFRQMDAEDMDLPDESVDAIVCKWGLMLMLDPQAALRECHRVLRPGGRLACSVWGGAEKNPWVTVYGLTAMQLGHELEGDPFGPGGMFSMADPDSIRSMLSEAGFEGAEVEEMPVHWRFDSFEQTWEFAREVAGAIARLIKQLPADEIEKLRAALEPATEPFKKGEGYDFPGVTINAAARKA